MPRFLVEDTLEHFGSMVEPGVCQNRPKGGCAPKFGIAYRPDHSGYSSVGKGTCAHEARLDRRIDRRTGQSHVPRPLKGVFQGHHLGMGCAITCLTAAIAPDAEDRSAAHHDGPNGDFVGVAGLFRIGQRESHAPTIQLGKRSRLLTRHFVHRLVVKRQHLGVRWTRRRGCPLEDSRDWRVGQR